MKQTLSFICLLIVQSQGWAAPFNGAHVPENAKWLMHMDMEALHNSALGEKMRHKWLMRDKVQKHLNQIREETGMDPSEDILGVTLFDSKFKKHHGVAVVYVKNADGQKLLARLNEKEPENEMVEFGPHKIYVWSKDGHHGHKGQHTVCGTLYDERVMVFSRDLLQVMAVLNVLDGKKPGLSTDSSLGAEPHAGTVMLMRGEGLDQAEHHLRCPVLKDSKWFEVQVGAQDGKSFLNMVIDTNDETLATNAKGVLDGFRALVSLRHPDEELQTLLSGLDVSATGTQIAAKWLADESATLEALESMSERWRKRGEKWKKWKKH